MQSGCYIDYVIKKLTEICVRNVFIYAALFFGEKFIVEFISKKTVDNLTLFITSKLLNRDYHYSMFYNNLIMFISITVACLELWFLIG